MSLFIFHYCTQCALGYLLKLPLICNNHILIPLIAPTVCLWFIKLALFLTQTVPLLSIKLIQLILKVKVEVNRESTKLCGCYKLGLNQKSTEFSKVCLHDKHTVRPIWKVILPILSRVQDFLFYYIHLASKTRKHRRHRIKMIVSNPRKKMYNTYIIKKIKKCVSYHFKVDTLKNYS